MAYRFVTGIDTDGEFLAAGDALTVLTGAAITVATPGTSGIASTGVSAKATVFGDVAAADVGIRLEGEQSTVFIAQSGNVTGGRLSVSLGSSGVIDPALIVLNERQATPPRLA